MKVTGVITTTSVADGATTTAVVVPIVATGAVVEPGITAVAGERTETMTTTNSNREVDNLPLFFKIFKSIKVLDFF